MEASALRFHAHLFPSFWYLCTVKRYGNVTIISIFTLAMEHEYVYMKGCVPCVISCHTNWDANEPHIHFSKLMLILLCICWMCKRTIICKFTMNFKCCVCAPFPLPPVGHKIIYWRFYSMCKICDYIASSMCNTVIHGAFFYSATGGASIWTFRSCM